MSRKILSALILTAASLPLAAQSPEPAPPKPAQDKEVSLSRLQGTAYIDRRTKVVGAAVLVSPEEQFNRYFLTSTDGKGRFRLDDLADGAYSLSLDRDGFTPVTKEGITVRHPFRAVIEVAMSPGKVARRATHNGADVTGDTTIRANGQVLERGGGPVGEVRLRFVHPTGRREPHRVRSADDGTFELNLPQGEWILYAWGVGFLPLRTRLDLREDTEFRFSLVKQPATYTPTPLELMPPELPVPPPGLGIRPY